MSVPIVLEVDDGRWKWWEGLQVVSFYFKGRRIEGIDVHIPARNNHFNGAVIAACNAEIKRRKAMVNEQQNNVNGNHANSNRPVNRVHLPRVQV